MGPMQKDDSCYTKKRKISFLLHILQQQASRCCILCMNVDTSYPPIHSFIFWTSQSQVHMYCVLLATRGIFVILLSILVLVLGPTIAFFTGQREYLLDISITGSHVLCATGC
ncbi:hypothetical protein SORBI_3004G080700 [Sorghum bicolor]|uniref:Uncharacterized protein n=1 Tax=Sorghum bicolor TaxID=4558 RepID=A0A194YNF1_SORBI|nr:hypothetical protein SORBI_3004G080700 [Sorghum bicolor]